MKSILTTSILLTTLLFSGLVLAQSGGQPTVEISKGAHTPFRPIDSSELALRYPKGKAWNSLAVMRATGSGSATKWGIQGETEFVLQNRYLTSTEILSNTQFGETTTIKLRCKVIDSSSSHVVSKKRLRLTKFESEDPIFNYLLEKGMASAALVSPEFAFARQVFKKWEEIDPNLQASLTKAGELLGIDPSKWLQNEELSWLEEPKIVSGYTFDLEWDNGFGVQSVTQVGKPSEDSSDLSLDTLRKWGEGADPLAELYIFPSLSKRIGDKWQLDASRATPIFSGVGDARSTGQINLKYVSDGTYDNSKARNIDIENGNVQVVLKEDANETRYEIDSMTGIMRVGDQDGMLLMSNGTGQFSYSKLSRNHVLFKAELTRDVTAKWRYEAVRIDK